MNIEGLIITPLKIIQSLEGDVYHGIKKSDSGYSDFSEAYFSSVKYLNIKSWKKHFKMTLNIIVPIGEIMFVIYDDRVESPSVNTFISITLSHKNYCRLTIPPNLWVAFQGIGQDTNMLLNVADFEHDPNEIERKRLSDIPFDGWKF